MWLACVLMATSLAASDANASSARADVARLVRVLGYGAGIHHFKNYVLRGRESYHTAARLDFREALVIIDALSRGSEFDASDQQALAALRTTVAAYDAALDRVTELKAKGWRIEDIDRSVIIDDGPAKAGLDVLRAKWKWRDFEEMEFQLGYGKAIHDFKNYVLRGQERYHAGALETLLAAEALIASQLSLPELTTPEEAATRVVERRSDVDRDDADAVASAREEAVRGFTRDRAALEAVERVARAYRNNLALIEKLLRMLRPVRQIDLAIKINDGPAVEGLTRLREASPYLHGLARATTRN
jgi:hypothetical protein